jgi:hypothetical protein
MERLQSLTKFTQSEEEMLQPSLAFFSKVFSPNAV